MTNDMILQVPMELATWVRPFDSIKLSRLALMVSRSGRDTQRL